MVEDLGSGRFDLLLTGSGLTTEQLIYAGRTAGLLVVPSLEPEQLPKRVLAAQWSL